MMERWKDKAGFYPHLALVDPHNQKVPLFWEKQLESYLIFTATTVKQLFVMPKWNYLYFCLCNVHEIISVNKILYYFGQYSIYNKHTFKGIKHCI